MTWGAVLLPAPKGRSEGTCPNSSVFCRLVHAWARAATGAVVTGSVQLFPVPLVNHCLLNLCSFSQLRHFLVWRGFRAASGRSPPRPPSPLSSWHFYKSLNSVEIRFRSFQHFLDTLVFWYDPSRLSSTNNRLICCRTPVFSIGFKKREDVCVFNYQWNNLFSQFVAIFREIEYFLSFNEVKLTKKNGIFKAHSVTFWCMCTLWTDHTKLTNIRQLYRYHLCVC